MNTWDVEDTIAAIASGHSGSLRGIIRISGPETVRICDKVFVPVNGAAFSDIRTASKVDCSADLDGEALAGHILLWPTERSYTRQPTAEFHTVGSIPLLNLIVEKLCYNGVRLAEPGEFTLRAFLSGRIDLTQAEAVLGVIDSNGREQLDDALKQLAGGLSRPLDTIRTALIHILAELEAGLDFVEEDIEFISAEELLSGIRSAEDRLSALVEQIETRDTQLHLPKVVFAGPPNAGKSSLFNALSEYAAARDEQAGDEGAPVESTRAIVSDVAGTTRDYVTCRIMCDGIEVELVDTAGLDRMLDEESIDGQAQSFTAEMLKSADVLVHCNENRNPDRLVDGSTESLFVQTKCDLSDHRDGVSGETIFTSSVSGRGLSELSREIANAVRRAQMSGTGIVATTATRAADALREALDGVRMAGRAATEEAGHEIVAAEIRQALDSLGRVVGTIYTDDILDRIFSQFCIGK